MALTKLAKINDNSFWAVWKIEESAGQLTALLQPSCIEYQEMERIVHHPRKKLEWLAGRLALQSLLNFLAIAEWKICKDVHGKPHLLGHDLHISLANSFPYATAIVHKQQAVGIDIEHPSEKLLRVRHKFLNPHELEMAGLNQEVLCLFWCAKESVYKIHGRKMLSFKEHMAVEHFDRAANILTMRVASPFQQASHWLLAERIHNFYVVYNA